MALWCLFNSGQNTEHENTKKYTKLNFSSKICTKKYKIQEIQNWVSGTCHPSASSLPRAFYFHGKPTKPTCLVNVTANLSMTWQTWPLASQTHHMTLPCLVNIVHMSHVQWSYIVSTIKCTTRKGPCVFHTLTNCINEMSQFWCAQQVFIFFGSHSY